MPRSQRLITIKSHFLLKRLEIYGGGLRRRNGGHNGPPTRRFDQGNAERTSQGDLYLRRWVGDLFILQLRKKGKRD